MTTPQFAYQAVFNPNESTQVTSMIAYWITATGPLKAVLWSVPRKSWIYAPAIAASLLYDDQYQNQTKPIDRRTADRLAREHLATNLPTEEELDEICREGARLGQEWGPPET